MVQVADVPRTQSLGLEWLDEERRVAAATLVETLGSAPLEPGAAMLIDDRGHIDGSVTGGCVEAALFEEAETVLGGEPAHVVTYGISDGDAASVGLMCGGTVRVFVQELTEGSREPLGEARHAIEEDEQVAVATLLDSAGAGAQMTVLEGRAVGSLGVTELLDHAVERDARGLLDQNLSLVRGYGEGGQLLGSNLRVFIETFSSSPSMVIFGATDFAAAVAKLANALGYSVTICDARAPFVQGRRFAEAADVVVDWPDRHLSGRDLGPRDVVLVFTHDPKFDEPALVSALKTDVGYIGALGSRRTHADRTIRLREIGLRDEDIERIAAPCGLDIGARTPAETAVSILAEVIAARSGRPGGNLSHSVDPIHPAEVP